MQIFYFGVNLRFVRQFRRLTQHQLAARTHSFVTQTEISRLERGHYPKPDVVDALAAALQVPRDALLRKPRVLPKKTQRVPRTTVMAEAAESGR